MKTFAAFPFKCLDNPHGCCGCDTWNPRGEIIKEKVSEMNQTQVGKRNRPLASIFTASSFAHHFLYPILWMFLGSFKTNNEIYQNALAFPTGFDFTVYRDAWIAANFLRR